MSLESLQEEAEALGLKVDGRWSESRLVEEIEKAQSTESDTQEPEPDGPTAIKNIRGNPLNIGGVKVAPDGVRELTEEERSDEHLMRKIAHGIRTGILAES